jgi:hypothetical protein
VLLSSLQGAAVTAIKIEGVLHEFSSLAGVREIPLDGAQDMLGQAQDERREVGLTSS